MRKEHRQECRATKGPKTETPRLEPGRSLQQEYCTTTAMRVKLKIYGQKRQGQLGGTHENGLDSILSKMPSKLTSEFIERALLAKAWDVGNQVLYDISAANRYHIQDDATLPKDCFIDF